MVKLDGCTLLDNPALFSLARHCSTMVSLSVGRCHLVSDKGVQAIAGKCSHLQSLSLSGTKVSLSNVGMIVMYSSHSSCSRSLFLPPFFLSLSLSLPPSLSLFFYPPLSLQVSGDGLVSIARSSCSTHLRVSIPQLASYISLSLSLGAQDQSLYQRH